jgi:uncharacterized protein YqjF (DUF2071 family)
VSSLPNEGMPSDVSRTRTPVVEPITAAPPEPVRMPWMMQRWSAIAFLHWPVDVDALRPLVPDELTIDTFDSEAWVGLVPFRMTMRPPYLPPIPVLSTFPEINIRTYVRDAAGRRGLYFLSLDVPRSAAVVTARVVLGLPYQWSTIEIEETEESVAYRASRRAPSPSARTSIVVPVRRSVSDPAVDLVQFLTARFRLFARGPFGLYSVSVDHAPWKLRRVRGATVDDEFTTAAGVPVDGAPAHVHVAQAVDVRVGFPTRLSDGVSEGES